MGKFRKIYRLLGLIFPVLYILTNKELVLVFLFLLSFLLLIVESLRFKFPSVSQKYFQIFSLIAKEREEKTLLGTTYLVWGTFLTILFFEKEIAILALFFLLFGDTVSFYLGKIGKITLFSWGKTLEASLGVLITCLIIGLVLQNMFGLNLSFLIISIGALAASITEAYPLKIGKFYLDDNLTIPIFSALAMTLVKLLL